MAGPWTEGGRETVCIDRCFAKVMAQKTDGYRGDIFNASMRSEQYFQLIILIGL